ncbi:MAG: CAP domain-containing protein [Chloroflexi bacterium]|nr:CAP domain-containing protein [Chloroflexota bacterium]MDA1002351.1 CAP domain-containing protein [Chloroflexota bacterium]
MAHPSTARIAASAARRVTLLRRIPLGLLAALSLVALAPAPAHAHAHAEPNALEPPPVGGLTIGIAGSSDPAAVATAQAFAVETVSVLVPATQTWLVYIPGALANTLTAQALTPDSVVIIRRAGVLTVTALPPRPPTTSPSVSGNGNTFDPPPPGGLVQGLAGTNDPATLVARQSFAVESVSALDVRSQTWLVYLPSAPAFVSALRAGMTEPSSVVTVRRFAPAVARTPTPSPVPTAQPSDPNATAQAVIFASVNEEREAAGLPALTLDATMVAVARAHSRDMIARDFFGHSNPDGEDPFDRMRAAGVSFGYAAENLVSGQSGGGAHATLMASAPHRANILGEHYRRIGIGAIVRPGGGVMVTEVFAD